MESKDVVVQEDSTKNDIYREATKALESSDDEEEEGPALQASKNDHNYATRDEEDDEVDNASTATTDTNKLKKDEDDNEEEISEILTKLKNVLDFKQTVDTVYPYGYTSHTIDLATIANRILSGQARRIICMCGAGISVSAGIPDFRSPGTGLYSRLQEYKLPHPEAVFEIGFFKRNPKPFYLLAKELYPGNYAPTPTHHFMHLLHQKGVLLRCYTQNIDSLENLAGLPKESVIAAHGNFDGAHCVECRAEHDVEYVKSSVYKQTPCYCVKGRKGCKGLVKPAIVFFGESLPEKFWKMVPQDFPQADLLIVMGTSLVVQPFASLINKVNNGTPRLLINRERVGEDAFLREMGDGFNFAAARRDVFLKGDCDDGVRELCKMLGWEKELDALVQGWEKSAQSLD